MGVEFYVLVLVQVQLALPAGARLGGGGAALGQLERVVGERGDRQVVLADQRAVGVGEVRLGQLAPVRRERVRDSGRVGDEVQQAQVVLVPLEGDRPGLQQP